MIGIQMKRLAMKKNRIKHGSIIQSIFLIFLTLSQANAQTQGSLIPPGEITFLDSNGKPLSSGKVFNYTQGTTTPKTTYQDINQTVPNTNPIILDAAGRAKYWGIGIYRQVVQDKLGNLIWDVNTSTGNGPTGPTATGDGNAVGSIKMWPGAIAPNQYMFAYGQTLNRITYAPLFQAITSQQIVVCTSGSPIISGLGNTDSFWIGMTVELGCVAGGSTTVSSKTAFTVTLAANANVGETITATFFMWGNGDRSTTFTLPDYRGLIPMGNNIMGGVASSNISDANFGATSASSAGALGGAQTNSTTLVTGNLPPYTPAGTPVLDSLVLSSNISSGSGGGSTNITTGGFSAATNMGFSIASSSLHFVGTAQGGTSTPFTTIRIPPSKTINFIIKVTPDTAFSGTGVTSLGGMTGDIACGTGLTCAGGTISAIVTPSGAVSIITPAQYGAKCDNTTDDTTSLQNMFTTIAGSSGNSIVSFPAGATCLIYNSGQSLATALATWTNVKNVEIQGNGATLSVGATFTAETLQIFNLNIVSNFKVDGLNLSQVHPVTIGAPTPVGTQLVSCANGCSNISLSNSVVTGSQGPLFLSNTVGVYMDNVQSINSIYGFVADWSILSAFPGAVQGVIVRGLKCTNCDRTLFLKGIANANISAISQNPRANDVLISASGLGTINENVVIDYTVLPRTAGTGGSYITMGPSAACVAPCTGVVFRNISVNMDIDTSGDAAVYPAIKLIKGTTSSLGIKYEDLWFHGRIVGVPNAAGHMIDLFDSVDAPWSGESAQNIIVGPLYESGSATPDYYIDFAPFNAAFVGGYTCQDVNFAGSDAEINNTFRATITAAKNCNFGNGVIPALPATGGTGLSQPTSHSIMQTEGAANFGLITAATAGRIIVDQGAGVDWAAKTVSGDATLAANGVLTVTGAVKTVKKVPPFTSSSTYTPSAGMLYAIIECVGSGGSGAGGTGALGAFYNGGGGGSGGYSRTIASAASVGVSQVVTVGNGGTAPAAGNNNGNAGGDVSVGSLCIGKGGSGGLYAAAAQSGVGGGGGVSGTGDLTISGSYGLSGTYANTTLVVTLAGSGGNSFFGGGAAPVSQSGSGTTTTGSNGGNYGGGGSGGNANNVASTFGGGNGGKGVVFITEFNSQ